MKPVNTNFDSKYIEKIKISLKKVQEWVERHDYKGYEPFDGLSSPLGALCFGSTLLQRLLQQLIRQSPINLRPVCGVKPLESTKGRGYMAWGYLHRYQATGIWDYKHKALLCLDWLDRNKSPIYRYHSWGNQFDYAARGGKLPKDVSTVVWTSLIGFAYLKAYELFKIERHLEIIKSISEWILGLPRDFTSEGHCIGYTYQAKSSIHNSNMLGAAFLAMSAGHTGHEQAVAVAMEAMRFSCEDQLQNGAWYYGKEKKYHWIDSFHTGYNLDSLKRYIDATGDKKFSSNLEKGYDFFKSHFLGERGCPWYYFDRKYPLDIQCASQIIDTLTFFSAMDQGALKLALDVAGWTIANMQEKDGHFIYRQYPAGIKAKAAMIHWGQATMFRAMAHLLSRVGEAVDA